MRRVPLILTSLLLWITVPAASHAAHVNVIELDNQIISPVTAQYIKTAIERSETDGAVCLVLLLDTPGGLLDSTRTIVKDIMNAKVPVAVYVAPTGSRAGSAGVFITLAAHVAAMAPSTNIGAAHPVVAGEGGNPMKRLIRRFRQPDEEKRRGAKDDAAEEELVEEEERDPMAEKIVNDTVAWITTIARTRGRNEAWARQAVTESFSITETEAVQQRVVDVVAVDLTDLLAKMDGRTVTVTNTPVELATAGAEIVRIPMSRRQQFLTVITNPNIAYLLMMLGTLGLIFEFTHPGIGFPGIAGLICLLLALYAFQTLPINYAAIALLVIGLALLIAEFTTVSGGLLALGGAIALTLGSLMLVESPEPYLQVSLGVVIPTVATLSGLSLFLIQRVVRAHGERVATGPQGLLGEIGTASTDLAPDGQVFVHGELWSATSPQPVTQGERIRVIQVEGMRLLVEPVRPNAESRSAEPRQTAHRRPTRRQEP